MPVQKAGLFVEGFGFDSSRPGQGLERIGDIHRGKRFREQRLFCGAVEILQGFLSLFHMEHSHATGARSQMFHMEHSFIVFAAP